VFVAYAAGGWTITSCDKGKTWTTSHSYTPTEADDHSEWSGFGGIAAGNGVFVGASGWGAPGHVIFSDDGANWQDLPDANFMRNGKAEGLNDSVGGVAFTGTQFVMFSRYQWKSQDGKNWTASNNTFPPGVDQVRQVRGFPDAGMIVVGAESQSGNGHPVGNFALVSEDNGGTWHEGTGFSSACGNPIQHTGNIAFRNGVLLVGAQSLCRSNDRGKTWQTISAPGSIDDLFWDAQNFYAIANGQLYRSPNGDNWTAVQGQNGVSRGRGFSFQGSTAIFAPNLNVRYTPDGTTWTKVSGPALPAKGPSYPRDLIAGFAKPSAMCPQ
jgi:hypothetical protein